MSIGWEIIIHKHFRGIKFVDFRCQIAINALIVLLTKYEKSKSMQILLKIVS